MITAKPSGTPKSAGRDRLDAPPQLDRRGDAKHAAQPGLGGGHVVEGDAQAGDHAQRPQCPTCWRASRRCPAPAPGRTPPPRTRTPPTPGTGCPPASAPPPIGRHQWPRPAAASWRSSPGGRSSVGVDHLVVQVVRQRVGDGQQQAVGGGQRRSQATGGHQARDHVRQAGDLGVASTMMSPPMRISPAARCRPIDVGDRQQDGSTLVPGGHPLPATGRTACPPARGRPRT
jgi:hypothetical protein